MDKKNTITIYATDGFENEAYITGPVSIVASVDTFTELEQPVPELLKVLKEANTDHPIVFVSQVYAQTESTAEQVELKYRGAYYMVKKWTTTSTPEWVEVFLGPTIPNTNVLQAVADLDTSDGFIHFYRDKNNVLKAETVPLRQIPEFPQYILDQAKYYQEGIEHVSTGKDVWYHLDAKLEELGWNGDISDPDHNHTAAGSCQELYDLLYQSGDKVINIEKGGDGKLMFTIGDPKGSQTVYLKDQEILKNKLPVDPTNNIYCAFKFDAKLSQRYGLPEELNYDPNDKILIAINDEFVSPLKYNVLYDPDDCTSAGKKEPKIIIQLLRSVFDNYKVNDLILTMLVIKNQSPNPIDIPEICEQLESANGDPDNCLSFRALKALMYKLYVINKVEHITDVDYVYLSNNAKGELAWVNNFVPETNYRIYENSYAYEDTESVQLEDTVAYIKLGKINVPWDADTVIFIDNFYIPDGEYTRGPSNEGDVAWLKIPNTGLYWDPSQTTFKLKILFVTKAPAEVINHLAKAYITKRDAINILSNGKINLDDYVTYPELNKYANVGHSHSGYATSGHNHDSRYAPANYIPDNMITPKILCDTLEMIGAIGDSYRDYESLYSFFIKKEGLEDGTSGAVEVLKNNKYINPINGAKYYIKDTQDYREGDIKAIVNSNGGYTCLKKYEFTDDTEDYYINLKPIAGSKSEYVFFENTNTLTGRLKGGNNYYYLDGPLSIISSADIHAVDFFKDKYLFDTTLNKMRQYTIDDLNTESLVDSPKYYIAQQKLGQPIYLPYRDVYLATATKASIPAVLDPNDIEVKKESTDVSIKNQIAAIFSQFGINVTDDTIQTIAHFDSSQIDISDEDIKKIVNTKVEPTLNDVIKILNSKISSPVDAKNCYINESNLTAGVSVGGITEGDPLKNDVAGILLDLLSPVGIEKKFAPAKVKVRFFYKEDDVYREVNALESTHDGPLYCKSELVDKFDNHICTHAYELFCSKDGQEKVRLEYESNISNLRSIDRDYINLDDKLGKLNADCTLQFYANSLTYEYQFENLDSPLYNLKVIYPTIYYTLLNNTLISTESVGVRNLVSVNGYVVEEPATEFKIKHNKNDLLINLSKYEETYENSIEILQDPKYNNTLLLAIKHDLNFKLYNTVDETIITPALDILETVDFNNIKYDVFVLNITDTDIDYELQYRVVVEEK